MWIQSETVEEYDRRREYITGFQGSTGVALITLSKAVLWTDGRYHLQADEQLDCKWIIMEEGHENVSNTILIFNYYFLKQIIYKLEKYIKLI